MNKISLKAARINAGYTAREVAERLGMLTHQSITGYENGKFEPNISTAIKMCELYDVSVYDIAWFELPNRKRGRKKQQAED